MPTTSSLVTFAALSLALIVVPGPSVIFVVGRALSLGRRAALVTVLGNAAGVYAQVLLVATGLGYVVERSITVFTIVKLVGAGYLVWLGVTAIRGRHSLASALTNSASGSSRRRVWLDGFVVGVANPKAIIFFAAILPQFVEPHGSPAPLQMAALGLVFVTLALVSDSAWALAAGTARRWLAGSPTRVAHLGTAGGVAMIGLGAQLAVSGRRD
ncbi:MAG: LysE family translocator [Acidimicrobiales bacterium]